MVLIPRPPILMPDTRWLLHAAAEEGTAAPEGKGNTKGGTQADTGILMGLSLGSPCPLLWPRCPHPPGSSSGAPFNPAQLGRRHLGNRMGIQGGEGGDSRLCKEGTECSRLVGRNSHSQREAEAWSKPATNMATQSRGPRTIPRSYHQRSWQVLGPGGVPRGTMKEDRSWLGGGRLFRLSQGLRVQPRHKLWAYLGLSLEHNHEDQDAMKCGAGGGQTGRLGRGKGGFQK